MMHGRRSKRPLLISYMASDRRCQQSVDDTEAEKSKMFQELEELYRAVNRKLDKQNQLALKVGQKKLRDIRSDAFTYQVRGKDIKVSNTFGDLVR